MNVKLDRVKFACMLVCLAVGLALWATTGPALLAEERDAARTERMERANRAERQRSSSSAQVGGAADDRHWIVSPLPDGNLVVNPWFNGLDGWVDATEGPGGWTYSAKPGNPTPVASLPTAARISTGRGADRAGWSVDPGVHAYLYQIVPADPAKRTLTFDMYWVTHTVDPAEVAVYGGPTQEGPWTKVWTPFYQVHTERIVPESGRGQDLWEYYSGLTDRVTTTLEHGYPFYKLEIHAVLPDHRGGFKMTGVYFAVGDAERSAD